jgi:hypothetical protein
MRGTFGPRAVAPLIALALVLAQSFVCPVYARAVVDGPNPEPEVAAPATTAASAPSAPSPQSPPNSADADAAVRAFVEAHAPECSGGPLWVSADHIWVGCGSWGFAVLKRAATGLVLSERMQTAGSVVGFFEHGGKVWVRLVQERAEVIADPDAAQARPRPPVLAPMPELPKGSPLEPDPAPSASEGVLLGKVVSIDGLDVVINLGSSDGLTPKSRVAIATRGAALSGKATVIGSIAEVDVGRATVRVGLNEAVRVGDEVATTDEALTASRIAPRRATGVWELRGMVRPLLNLGGFGGGALLEMDAGYRMRYFHAGVNVWPLGLAGASNEGALTTWSTYVYGAFDSWLFSAGIGLGAQAVNDTGFLTAAGSGLGLVQLLRLGAVDGLHFMARTRAVVFHSQTEFSGVDAQGQISVSSDAWLLFRGGGGSGGYGFGEVAVRNLLRGNGDQGSLFLEVSVGGAGLFRSACPQAAFVTAEDDCTERTVAGPLVGLGAEWRL